MNVLLFALILLCSGVWFGALSAPAFEETGITSAEENENTSLPPELIRGSPPQTEDAIRKQTLTPIEAALAACQTNRFMFCLKLVEELLPSDRIPAMRKAIQEGHTTAAEALLIVGNFCDDSEHEKEFAKEVLVEYLKAKSDSPIIWDRLLVATKPEDALLLAVQNGNQFVVHHILDQFEIEAGALNSAFLEAIEGRQEVIVGYFLDENAANLLDLTPDRRLWLANLVTQRTTGKYEENPTPIRIETVLAICRTDGFSECWKSASNLYVSQKKSALLKAALEGNLYATMVLRETVDLDDKECDEFVDLLKANLERGSNMDKLYTLYTLLQEHKNSDRKELRNSDWEELGNSDLEELGNSDLEELGNSDWEELRNSDWEERLNYDWEFVKKLWATARKSKNQFLLFQITEDMASMAQEDPDIIDAYVDAIQERDVDFVEYFLRKLEMPDAEELAEIDRSHLDPESRAWLATLIAQGDARKRQLAINEYVHAIQIRRADLVYNLGELGLLGVEKDEINLDDESKVWLADIIAKGGRNEMEGQIAH